MYRRIVVGSTTAKALLERERELEALEEGLDGARAGKGSLFVIQGPAGVGKTELLARARAEAERAGVAPLAARGSELEQQFAFGIVRQLLEPVITESSSDHQLFAGAALPSARLFKADEQPPGGSGLGFEALHSLYWLIVNLTDRAPRLMMVDDCQWADADSLRFLSYLALRIEGLPIAIFLAGRPADSSESEAAALWAQVSSRPAAIALYPRPLSESGSMALARERLGIEADDEFCRACHRATGGNPLFLRELLRGLDAAGVVPSAGAASEVQVVGPAVVSRFILHRLAGLGPSATELARSVAVLGDDCQLPLAARVAGLRETTARESADELVRADIFADSRRLGFVHPIVRAALYEDLAPGERHARHAAVAHALAATDAEPERVTAHLLLTTPTGDQDRVRILRAAAVSAARRGAPAAAAARLQRALDEFPAEQERAEILAELGSYEVAAMQFDAAEEHLQACLLSDANLTTQADGASTLARYTVVSGGRSAEMAVDALSSLARQLEPSDRERSLELGSHLLMVATSVPRLRPALAEHLQRFRDQTRGHSGFEAVATIYSAVEQLFRGESAQTVAERVQGALAAGLAPSAATNAGLTALNVLRLAERHEVAARMLDLAYESARREGHAARQGLIHGQRAAIALARGALHDAQVEAETGLLLVAPPHFVIPQLAAVAIVVHIERGEFDQADELAAIQDAIGPPEELTYGAELLVARGRLRIAEGRVRDGVADLLWCGERLTAQGLLWPNEWRAFAAPALISLGERPAAVRLAEEQLSLAQSAGAPRALGISLRTAALADEGDQRLTLLQQALSVLGRSSARLELAYTFAALGAELSRVGRRGEGRDAQRRAIELAEECGALALADRARADLHAGPGRRPRAELTGRGALTAAEWRVCRQAADGASNREIAQALFVTEKTVERHLSSAYQKLEIRSRYQLAAALVD